MLLLRHKLWAVHDDIGSENVGGHLVTEKSTAGEIYKINVNSATKSGFIILSFITLFLFIVSFFFFYLSSALE